MTVLDFRLQHLRQSAPADERVHILLQYHKDLPSIEELGFQVSSIAGDVAAGSIPLSQLAALEEHPEVILVESSRPLKNETDVSSVSINLLDAHTNVSTIPNQGSGAVIGVIDSGFDLTHPSFLNSQKKTRILAAWDQMKGQNIPGMSPSAFGYGVEYTDGFINHYLAAKRILIIENVPEGAAHGTYVTGIAAGNGAPHGVYRGMAREAELILVTLNNSGAIGGSAFLLDAIRYIQQNARGRPVVINISQGDNLGAHDGTSLSERSIDYLVGNSQLLVVKSAGNGAERPSPHHAQGKVEPDRETVLSFSLAPDSNQIDRDTIELWYRRGDLFSVALESPSGFRSIWVKPGPTHDITFPAGNHAHIYSQTNYPANGDNHIGVVLDKGAGWEPGTWRLILKGDEVRHGNFDAWSDRPDGVTLINFKDFQSDAVTITLPGTARLIITVGGFVSRPVERGETGDILGGLALGSSQGPTRDGRIKPDLSAPSSLIMAPRRRIGTESACHDLQRGTSMAAPHVTGVIALLWAQWPNLTPEQIRSALFATAKSDVFTGATPNTSWGYGKLDAGAAYEALTHNQETEK